MKFRNQYEEIQKANRRLEVDFTRKVGAISPTTEGSGRYWHGSEENKEEKENKNK